MANIGTQIDALFKLKAKYKKAQEAADAVKTEITAAEQALMDAMRDDGIEKSTSKGGSISISKSLVPSVTDWDAYYAFIHKHKYYHLLERRPSATGCRELFEMGKKVPGVEPVTRMSLRYTAAK